MNDKGRTYKEVLTVLKSFDAIDKIPQNIIDNMKMLQDDSYAYEFNEDIPIMEQRISKEAAILLSVLYIKYISGSSEEIQNLKIIYEQNDEILNTRKFQDETTNTNSQKFNTAENQELNSNTQSINDDNINKVVVVEKNGFIEKLKNFLRKIF